jgi:hypothetical protein
VGARPTTTVTRETEEVTAGGATEAATVATQVVGDSTEAATVATQVVDSTEEPADMDTEGRAFPGWKWDIAARRGNRIVFMVGHMDLAYFLHHREEFRNAAHGRYMRSFIGPDTPIHSKDYKVLHNGTIVPFDEGKLDAKDHRIFDNYSQITFETVVKSAKPRRAKRR